MKRKYEFPTRTPGLSIQVEESGCPDTVTLSVIYMRVEVLALCLPKEDWMVLRQIGEDTSYSQTRFDWTPANEVTK